MSDWKFIFLNFWKPFLIMIASVILVAMTIHIPGHTVLEIVVAAIVGYLAGMIGFGLCEEEMGALLNEKWDKEWEEEMVRSLREEGDK